MSDPSGVLPQPDPNVLPGYKISKARLGDYVGLSEKITADFYASAGVAAARMPGRTGSALLAAALAEVANGTFQYGRSGYEAAAQGLQYVPYMLYLLLSRWRPELTPMMVEALVTDDNRAKIARAVWKAFGYVVDDPNEKNVEAEAGAVPPTSAPSSSPSASVD